MDALECEVVCIRSRLLTKLPPDVDLLALLGELCQSLCQALRPNIHLLCRYLQAAEHTECIDVTLWRLQQSIEAAETVGDTVSPTPHTVAFEI